MRRLERLKRRMLKRRKQNESLPTLGRASCSSEEEQPETKNVDLSEQDPVPPSSILKMSIKFERRMLKRRKHP